MAYIEGLELEAHMRFLMHYNQCTECCEMVIHCFISNETVAEFYYSL